MAGPAGDMVLSCHECGASVYKEHLDQGMAGFRAGKLLCSFCMKQKERKHDATPPPPPAAAAAEPAAATAASGESEGDLPPISLVDVLEAPESSASKATRSTATVTPAAAAPDEYRPTRPLNKTGTGATRCKIFHCKLSDEATRHLEQQINEWCDQHPDVEIKSCSTTVGNWTGKHVEPNLIISIFY